jgi:lipopolysaccharide/colanic/teichoic acid biosynthesis glycosyltransferase
MLMISLAVRLTSPGPVFYRQRRVSRDGGDFEMLKFRTMYDSPDFEGAGGTVGGCRAAWAAAILHPEVPLGELVVDRRTPLGRFLRRCSLDELPQFINVLRGDMSLVGPRPETPLLVKGFEVLMYRYGDRHRVKCGITGWAQVHDLRGDTSLQDRVEWDNYYIDNWSPWLDLKILVMTIPAALRGRHAD